jgi:hypothetical protein
MASDYEAITRENILELGRGFERIGNFLAEKLYGDRSHFIYELLQNAEDALALRRQREPAGDFPRDVTFRLCKDHLEVSHYGKLFDENDVSAICDVLRGTKTERLDQIGTFGIGFKSVYAFTRSPEVHSGDEHFVIEQFIRPRGTQPRPLANTTQTLFFFPFDHPDFPATSAFDLIQSKLKSVGPRSLLFLHHIESLIWIVEGSGKGLYIRETISSDKGGAFVQIVGEGSGGDHTEEEWLVVQRNVRHPSRDEELPVKMAYSLDTQREGKSVKALAKSPLTAFFPTAKETGLGVLVHAPFASTPARDNIQSDSKWNDLLLSELATLVADSLEVCKRHGFLKADFLAALPVDSETFPLGSPFRPIYDAVRNAFCANPLVPTARGGHALVSQLVLGRSQELRELLPPDVLSIMLGAKSQARDWVDPAVTENRLPKVWQYLRDACGIPVIDGEAFARYVITDFLVDRDEAWMVKFYTFLTGQEALWRAKGIYGYPPEGPLRSKAIIRCEDGRHRTPFDRSEKPVVFLPVESAGNYPIVKRTIHDHEMAAEFVRRLGLVAPDICTLVIAEVLPQYAARPLTLQNSDHMKHLAIIRDALALKDSPRNTEMVTALKSTTWVLAKNAGDEKLHYCFPTIVFKPLPQLKTLFQGNREINFLAEEDGIDWAALGIRSAPVVHCAGLHAGRQQFVHLTSHHGRHKRGFDGFDPNTAIDGLEHAIKTITAEKAAYIWNELLPPLIRSLHGRYQTATHQNFDNATTHEGDSKLCELLKQCEWIPVADNTFKRPPECTVADVPSDFTRNAGLIAALGIQPDPEQVAHQTEQSLQDWMRQAGFSSDVAALLILHKTVLTADIINQVISAHNAADSGNPEFPRESPLPDKERRAARIRERTQKADPKTYDKRKRSVRTSSPAVDPALWLREKYTNNDHVMVCQMCCKAMPFKVPRTGEYYFEAVQIADNFAKEDHCLYLALCPLCAAKYKVLVKKDDDRLSEFIWAVEQADNPIVPVGMEDSCASLHFVESHLSDVKIALGECLSESLSASAPTL